MPHQQNSFFGHIFRHGNNQLVAFCRANRRQTDAGVPRGCFHKNRFRLYFAAFLRRFDHFKRYPVLNRKRRIIKLALGQNMSLDFMLFCQPRKFDQRRLSDQLGN